MTIPHKQYFVKSPKEMYISIEIRKAHVNKIKSNLSGDMASIKVVFDSTDQRYHIIQGQHVFTALVQLMVS